ncbi:DUF4870 domain-containing protein [Antarcticibacterium arcticum]|uniref:DUF4870 domain-containing protein n=1 Tax=Antarcticibacterium arcticum TaxID=2585771 RepID=A0A5B8YL04_9FLAO|nr:DUF4870 domain-containing protein [Antarcticibacterium arcticum]QED37313.1 DUF4870 domain-containing protein [Antarcticibacterium arcticum]
METLSLQPDKTVASLIHVSAFSKYFIPFGNFIIPLILWTAKKNDPFVDSHGKQALNFQISIFLYFVFLVCAGIAGVVIMGFDIAAADPSFFREENFSLHPLRAMPLITIVGITGLLLLTLFILEIVAVINAAIKASEGKTYKYPLTINFITPTPVGIHQSKNDQFNNTQKQTL